MDKVIELELELRDGGSYYLCDSKFSVMSGKIRRHVNAIESYYQDYASVNGFAVKHTYEEVVEMIRKAKGDDRLIHRPMGEIDWQCDEGICEHTDRVAGKCACYNKEIGVRNVS